MKIVPTLLALAIGSLGIGSLAPAMAQDAAAKPNAIVLEAKSGTVMAASGAGDAYETAGTGKVLSEGDSLMLSDGAKATVVYYYDNGNRKCTEQYQGPNTYVIDGTCVKAAGVTSSRGGLANAGIIVAGAAVLGAAFAGGGGDDEKPNPPPVSP